MSTIFNQVLFHWLDKNGKQAVNFMTTQDQTAGGAGAYSTLATAMQACSVAGLIAIQYQTTLVIDATPGDGAYETVFDRAVMLSRIEGENRPTKLAIIAPKEEIFQADTLRVDLSNASVMDLNDAVMAVLGDPDGHPNGPFRRGQRQRARGEG